MALCSFVFGFPIQGTKEAGEQSESGKRTSLDVLWRVELKTNKIHRQVGNLKKKTWLCIPDICMHNCMAAADSAVILLELNDQWDLARTH